MKSCRLAPAFSKRLPPLLVDRNACCRSYLQLHRCNGAGKGYTDFSAVTSTIKEGSLCLERLPYRATAQSAAYDRITRLPVRILLDNVRSLYNVGSFFRTADAAGIEKLYLSGITGTPPQRALSKTALGAEETVPWEHTWAPVTLLEDLHARGMEIAAVETTPNSIDIFEWVPRFPVCVLFGHEVDGLRAEVSAFADVHVRIPMLGRKHSLNVSTAGGIVMYELLRKYVQAGL